MDSVLHGYRERIVYHQNQGNTYKQQNDQIKSSQNMRHLFLPLLHTVQPEIIEQIAQKREKQRRDKGRRPDRIADGAVMFDIVR